MFRRKGILLAALLLLISLFALARWFRKPYIPFSSPTAVRPNEAYDRAHAPAQDPSFPEDIFHISIGRTNNELSITYPSGDPHAPELDYATINIHKAGTNQAIPLGTGSMRLAYIGTVTDISRGKPGSAIRTPAAYFTADLKPFTDPDSLPLRPWERDMLLFRLPSAQFVFACSNIADFKPLRLHTFDARTHYPLASGFGDGLYLLQNTDSFTWGTPLNLWHQTPIELVTTVAIGPAQFHSLPPTEGAELQLREVAFKLLFAGDVEFEDESERANGVERSATLTVLPSPKSEGLPKRFSLLFYCWPQSRPLAADFECYDHAGNKMVVNTKNLGARLAICEVLGSLDQLKEIRVKHYPNRHRLIFTIPELPGLPEENRNLNNLFDVRIPYINLRNPIFSKVLLGQIVQMHPNVLVDSQHSFQSEHTNTTALAIFREIDHRLRDGYTLVADSKVNELRAERLVVRSMINSVKRTFGIGSSRPFKREFPPGTPAPKPATNSPAP